MVRLPAECVTVYVFVRFLMPNRHLSSATRLPTGKVDAGRDVDFVYIEVDIVDVEPDGYGHAGVSGGRT